MTHDIQDLLNLIKELEQRIIDLEKRMSMCAPSAPRGTYPREHDAWYWDH